MSDTTQVELRSGRVQAPAARQPSSTAWRRSAIPRAASFATPARALPLQRKEPSAALAATFPRSRGLLRLVHLSAQRKHFLSICRAGGALGINVGGAQEVSGVIRVYFVSKTAHVELRSGRVSAPAQVHSLLVPIKSLSGVLSPGAYTRSYFRPT